MFFTTYPFIFLFLPLVLLGFHALRQSRHARFTVHGLVLASALFYAALDRLHLGTLALSIVVNYLLAARLQALVHAQATAAKRLFWLCLAFNAGYLVLFKYVLPAAGLDVPVPLGLSFFTLVQIGLHIAVFTGHRSGLPPASYGLMVGYFPCVVAGPVLTRQQFDPGVFTRPGPVDVPLFLSGLMLFAIGLFKKVVLADSVAADVAATFGALGAGTSLSTGEAWIAATLYTLQLYFDFSGYTDMACGISALFGHRLPRNFHSPLKATSIQAYWRRWHMTVTRFFTNNLYLLVTLRLTRWANQRRLGPRARFAATVFGPTFTCFALIGVWHGSGANFVWFGLLMASAMSLHQRWAQRKTPLPKPIGWALTMLVVVAGMILDKTASGAEALSIMRSMAGLGSDTVQVLQGSSALWKLAGLAAIALACPNSHQILSAYQPVLPEAWDDRAGMPPLMRWAIGARGMAAASVVLVAGLVAIPNAAQFIYYRF